MESYRDQVFVDCMLEQFGAADTDRLLDALGQPASVSVRLNPFKCPEQLPILEGAVKVPWSPYGYMLEKRPVFTLHPLFHAGAYYVQDSSAMFVGHLFRHMLERIPGRSLRVLDLCAAPGGKTTDLAASLRQACGDDFLLVANEVMRQRASVLSDNVAIWGDPNVVVTSVDPKAFASFEGFFDIIVADVPCSGEGMFRKDAQAVRDWSPATVDLCASRQRRIISDVWPALRRDGVMIYSTCTFSRSENDDNIAWMAETFGAEPLCEGGDAPFEGIRKTRYGYLLMPGDVPGEGQYASAVLKTDGETYSRAHREDLARLRPLRMGVHKGVTKGTDFVPDPDWILNLSYERGTYPEAEVDKMTALHFLHRDSIVLPDAPRGYNVLTYRGVPIGIVKNLINRCNNLHPQGRRILMDITEDR